MNRIKSAVHVKYVQCKWWHTCKNINQIISSADEIFMESKFNAEILFNYGSPVDNYSSDCVTN